MNKYEQKMKQLIDKWIEYLPPTSSPVSEIELQALEQQLGSPLPADYREFLRDYGNTYVLAAAIIPEPTLSGPTHAVTEHFFGITPDNKWTDLFTRSQLNECSSEFLQIGESDLGNLFIVMSGKQRGAIYFYDCGWGWKFYFVASSFDKFLSKLE